VGGGGPSGSSVQSSRPPASASAGQEGPATPTADRKPGYSLFLGPGYSSPEEFQDAMGKRAATSPSAEVAASNLRRFEEARAARATRARAVSAGAGTGTGISAESPAVAARLPFSLRALLPARARKNSGAQASSGSSPPSSFSSSSAATPPTSSQPAAAAPKAALIVEKKKMTMEGDDLAEGGLPPKGKLLNPGIHDRSRSRY